LRDVIVPSGGLPRRASAESCGVVDIEMRGDRAQAATSGGEESAQEATIAEFVEPGVPGFHGGAEPFQDC
jgi:hypothetical protein